MFADCTGRGRKSGTGEGAKTDQKRDHFDNWRPVFPSYFTNDQNFRIINGSFLITGLTHPEHVNDKKREKFFSVALVHSLFDRNGWSFYVNISAVDLRDLTRRKPPFYEDRIIQRYEEYRPERKEEKEEEDSLKE